MGKLSGELTKDAFIEVANDFISGNLSHQEPASIVPVPLLQGTAVIDGVLDPEQRLAKLRGEIKKSAKLLREKFGIETRRRILGRLSGTEQIQNVQIEVLKGHVRELSSSVSNLMQSIDATNGLDWEEIRALRSSGVNLQEVERLLSGSTLENTFIDQVTNFTQSSVGLSHSISQIRETLFQLSQKVKTRDRQTTLDEVEAVVEKVTEALEVVEQRQKQAPKGLLFRAGRSIARVLGLGWPRIVLGVLYIWTLSAGLTEIISDSGGGFIPWPSPIRDVLHLTALTFCVALTFVGVLAGLLLLHADKLVKQWGLSFRLDDLSSKVDSMLESLVSVAVNDWACYRTRTRTHRILVSLDGVLARVAETVNEQFVTPFESEDPEMAPKERPNPRVRRDLNDRAQGKAFMYIDDIKRIIHVDLSVMIGDSLQSIYALKTVAGGELVPARVQESLSYSLHRYVRDAKNFGLLYEELSTAESAVAKRRALARRIWEEPSLVDEALKTVVLTRSPVKLVTFVSPDDLVLLAADEDQSREIRFIPSHASRRLLEVQNHVGFHPNVVHVEGMSAAGVVRISPLRSVGSSVD